MKKRNIYLSTVILLILWGSFAAVSKLSLKSLDSFQTQFYMFGSAFVTMTVVLAFNGKAGILKSLTRKSVLLLALISLPSFLYYFLYLLSLKMIPAVEASMLNYLFPIMIVVFAGPINKEKFTVIKFASVILGFAGMIVIITNGDLGNIRMSNLAGDLLAVGAAVSWGVFSNLGKRNGIDIFISNYIYTAVNFILSAAALFIFSRFTIPGFPAVLGILWIGLSNITLSLFIWFKILKSASTALAASLSFITPFVTLLFIMLLLGEKMTLVQLAGLGVIVVGIVLQSFENPVSEKLRSLTGRM